MATWKEGRTNVTRDWCVDLDHRDSPWQRHSLAVLFSCFLIQDSWNETIPVCADCDASRSYPAMAPVHSPFEGVFLGIGIVWVCR